MIASRHPRRTGLRDGIIAGYVLKLARESANCTQTEMAAQLDIDPQTVHSWETGRRSLGATSVRALVQLQLRLVSLGVGHGLIDSLNRALEADYILNQILTVGPDQIDVMSHPLANWLLPHTVSEMLAWPLTGTAPSTIEQVLPKSGRRGPVSPGPELSVPERARFFQNLSVAAALIGTERTLDDPRGLLAHQLYLRIGWSREATTRDWLRTAHAHHLARYPRVDRWSPRWLELRSLVLALAHHGDPEPIQRFVRSAHQSDDCEMANLNYWAYWAGELRERQRTQDFMVSSEALRSWTGATLLRRLVDRLIAANPHLELNIHSIRTLLGRSVTAYVLDSDPDLARSMRQRIDRLLEHGPSVSHHARRELEDIRRRTAHA